MMVNDFRFISVDDAHDRPCWDNWSRVYEYPMTMLALERLAAQRAPGQRLLSVHNTACGASPIATTFAEWLYRKYNVLNTDVEPMTLPGKPTWPWVPNYRPYNILTPTADRFDAVLCISTIEHIEPKFTELALRNLFDQVLPGGILVVTIDIPPADLSRFEKFAGRACVSVPGKDVTATTSIYPDRGYGDKRVAYLEVEREGGA